MSSIVRCSDVSRGIVKGFEVNYNEFDMRKVIFQKIWLSDSILK